MARLIIANRRGHQTIEWDPALDTDENRAAIAEAERIIEEARRDGCRVAGKGGDQHVLAVRQVDPTVEEYQIIAPIAGG